MAASRAAPAGPPADPTPHSMPAPAAPAPEPPLLDASEAPLIDDSLEKDEPIAILEQEDAIAILEEDDPSANAILEVDAEGESADGALRAVFEDDPGALPAGDEPEAVLEDSNPDFEFGGAAASAASADEYSEDAILDESDGASGADFELGSAQDDEAADIEFEFGAEPEAQVSQDFEIGDAPAADLEEESDAISDAVDEALQEATDDAEAPIRAIDILPVEIGADGMVAYEVAHAQRTRVDYRAIEAIAAAEVTGLADEPILVVELILRARAGRPRSSLRMRCDTFDPASLFPDRTDAGQALRAMLSDLLERTRAVPLPDPDSALAIQPQRYESLADFEAAVLARLPA